MWYNHNRHNSGLLCLLRKRQTAVVLPSFYRRDPLAVPDSPPTWTRAPCTVTRFAAAHAKMLACIYSSFSPSSFFSLSRSLFLSPPLAAGVSACRGTLARQGAARPLCLRTVLLFSSRRSTYFPIFHWHCTIKRINYCEITRMSVHLLGVVLLSQCTSGCKTDADCSLNGICRPPSSSSSSSSTCACDDGWSGASCSCLAFGPATKSSGLQSKDNGLSTSSWGGAVHILPYTEGEVGGGGGAKPMYGMIAAQMVQKTIYYTFI